MGLTQIFEGINVLVTGHTGFKGSWLSLWLCELGAHVIGYSLPPPTTPSNFEAIGLQEKITHIIGDIRDNEHLQSVIKQHQPSVIFHLAAQPLVLRSYEDPKETFDVNVGGTVNVLEAARHCPAVKAVVIVTTDKCYENREWIWGYRENDTLGGNDPYSASKAMAELSTTSYRRSFSTVVASARAGNVIGGGDFSDFRLVPDSMKALMDHQPVKVRNAHSVRPWLHVLDPLSGYLWLAALLLEKGSQYAEAWNFGPLEQEAVTTKALVEKAIELWGDGDWVDGSDPHAKPEMGMLRLNWDKAANRLKWRPTYNWEQALEQTVSWFKEYDRYRHNPKTVDMRQVCIDHIRDYTAQAEKQGIAWACDVLFVSKDQR